MTLQSFVDYKTDTAIQSSLRNELHNVTQIIVAHRLQTIIDADKIVCIRNRMMAF
jgi:ABC-type transport system involved in Fe-S cluster assembly fused permease/ATPase subunit